MTGDILLWVYQALAAAGVFVAVFALLRLRRENQDLREKLEALERREASRRDAAARASSEVVGHPISESTQADGGAS